MKRANRFLSKLPGRRRKQRVVPSLIGIVAAIAAAAGAAVAYPGLRRYLRIRQM